MKKEFIEDYIKEIDASYKDKKYLTVEDLSSILECNKRFIYNVSGRMSVNRRLPKLTIQKRIKFPKKLFYDWLMEEFYRE